MFRMRVGSRLDLKKGGDVTSHPIDSRARVHVSPECLPVQVAEDYLLSMDCFHDSFMFVRPGACPTRDEGNVLALSKVDQVEMIAVVEWLRKGPKKGG